MTEERFAGTFTRPPGDGSNLCEITDRRGNTIVWLRCAADHEHALTTEGCGFKEQYGRYASAAIAEGRCPWGDGPLGEITGIGEDQAGGVCGTCQAVWTTSRDGGPVWGMTPLRDWVR